MKNYSKILDVSRDASQEEIRKAYLNLAQKWHPDKFETQGEEKRKEAENKFKEIGEAYENLKNGIQNDEDKRSHHFQQDDINEMLRNFARQAGFGFGFNPQQQQDYYEEVVVPVTMENLYNQESLDVTITSFDKEAIQMCTECGGSGQKVVTTRQGNMIMNRATRCHVCNGQGFKTNGIGVNKDYKILADINNLFRPRPLGKVGSYNPITNDHNNVVVRFDLQKSYNYSLVENGAGLMMVLPVLYEHLRDGKKLRITIFGNKVTVDVPEKPSLQRMIVVPEKGMPLGHVQKRGNLYIKLDIRWEE